MVVVDVVYLVFIKKKKKRKKNLMYTSITPVPLHYSTTIINPVLYFNNCSRTTFKY